MQTRTSQSSPCFLRVAEASAASSASKMISLSTPFSFETASTTIRISLFIARLPPPVPLRRQSRAANLAERQPYLSAVHRQLNNPLVQSPEPARVASPAIARQLELHVDPFAHEALE